MQAAYLFIALLFVSVDGAKIRNPEQRFRHCCRQRTTPACVPACTYSVTLSKVIEVYEDGNCPPEVHLPEILRCASRGRNNTDCCRSIAGFECTEFCEPDPPPLTELTSRHGKCATYLGEVMQCLHEGAMENAKSRGNQREIAGDLSYIRNAENPILATTTATTDPRVVASEDTDRRFLQCCQANGLPESCFPMCSYGNTFDTIMASYKSGLCPPEQYLNAITQCASGNHDNSACCKDDGIAGHCLRYCQAKPDIKTITAKDAKCAKLAPRIAACHKNYVANNVADIVKTEHVSKVIEKHKIKGQFLKSNWFGLPFQFGRPTPMKRVVRVFDRVGIVG